jgi:thymidylate kinase
MPKAQRLRTGSLVVFEGLDRAGKSTQIDRFRQAKWAEPEPLFMHMPSGQTELTRAIYGLTEHAAVDSPLCRQLLHLACHAENQTSINAARMAGGVVLDRWWWSTVAYGWATGALQSIGLTAQVFFGLISAVWRDQPPDAVLLFLNPYELDTLNTDAVTDGYRELAAAHADVAIIVPSSDPDATEAFVAGALRERGILAG